MRVAAVQLNARPDWQATRPELFELVERAAGEGAGFVATPENTGFLAFGREALLVQAEPEANCQPLEELRALAARLKIHLLIGSLAIRKDADGDNAPRLANRSFLVDPSGEVLARYDKIHLFDIDLGGGEAYRESALYDAGTEAVAVELPFGKVGLTICYDLRFPTLYRGLAQAGATILMVPSAFTVPTGEAHWHALLRARAIENAAYVVAPAQTGTHHRDRKTYGHALIVDPWGEVLADAGDKPGLALAEIEADHVARVRDRLPSLRHDRPFAGP